MEKRKWHQKELDKKAEVEAEKTDFQRVLAERAKKIDCVSVKET